MNNISDDDAAIGYEAANAQVAADGPQMAKCEEKPLRRGVISVIADFLKACLPEKARQRVVQQLLVESHQYQGVARDALSPARVVQATPITYSNFGLPKPD